jgi:hypothetical protein
MNKLQEATVANHMELAAGYQGLTIWRNNSGACLDETGRLIRFGLGNISEKFNKEIKSSDFIGITPLLIEPYMFGQIVGVFTALETKPSDWKFRLKDERAVAQKKFHDIVKASGGYAGFVTCNDDMMRIIGRGH